MSTTATTRKKLLFSSQTNLLIDSVFLLLLPACSATGANLSDLYEVMDGGHPSVSGEILLGQYVWDLLERTRPDVIGPVNPNNQRILDLFGDQGGY